MQVALNLEGLTHAKLVRLAKLLEALCEPQRSEAFNRFLFWTVRETEREVRGRLLGLPLHHALCVDLYRMRPGEVVFLRCKLRDWRIEFGEYTMGQLADLFWHASPAGLAAETHGPRNPAVGSNAH